MSRSTLSGKLRIKSGFLVSLINPPPGYKDLSAPLPEGTRMTKTSTDESDAVLLFVNTVEELEKFARTAMDAVKSDGLLWIRYPKRSSKINSDINRDVVWKIMIERGMRAVSAVAIDDVWSALRFRPVEKVGK